LLPGDRITLVAPASPFRREEFDRGVAELTALGFAVTYDDRIFARDGYVAGSAALRAAVLHEAWTDPDVRGIVAVRGGFGSAQTLPYLQPDLLRRARKVFVGYSDVTVLLWLHLLSGMTCFHGPMLEGRFARGAAGYDRESFLNAVGGQGALGAMSPPGLEVLWPGEARGQLVGGTLTQLLSLSGTRWSFAPPRGCVLFLEDTAERPYRIDRMLTQLQQSGVLGGAAGIVFGAFPGCDEPAGTIRAREVLWSSTRGLGVPVLFGFPSGHTDGPAWTLPLGVTARIVAGARPALVIEQPAVG
jgi:muramoyltetrapeptide carboxypeptidase